jgi:hypothetical protein
VISEILESFVEPWYESIEDPVSAQNQTLQTLLKGYSKTTYGKSFGAESVASVGEYRRAFPVTDYPSLAPYLDRVGAGQESVLLPETVVRWVMTRGTTGRPKLIPATETHLSLILSAGARAIVNFGLTKKNSVLQRPVLNLNFPSELGRVEGKGPTGYSSGTYAKLNPGLGPAVLVPAQEEIDKLGTGIGKGDWERRFEFAYQRAREVDIGSTMGVTPVILAFAAFLRRRHGTLPRSLWKPDALFCTSVPKIHTRYGPQLRHYFGEVPIVEMYSATEGVFAQQRDNLPYVCPNYDCYYLEVKTRGGFKMLHEMKRGEWGRVIVSTPLFPRYDIGDFIEAQGKGYFRVLGRASRRVAVEHLLFNTVALRRL